MHPSFKEIIFWAFMIALYYTGYARWFFWLIFIIHVLAIISFLIEKRATPFENILKTELTERGY